MSNINYVYADCAASAPILFCARENMSIWSWANPHSVHYLGRESHMELEYARETIARCINAEPGEIGFTPSATAACQYAVKSFPVTACSSLEHKAVFDAVQGRSGLFGNTTYAMGAMLANNETGEVYDGKVKELSENYTVFTDATAAVGQIPVDVKEFGVAALAAGGHKFGAYPGIGFIYVRGGVSDDDTFPGTPPVGLAVAMASALEYRTEHMTESFRYLVKQTDYLALSILDIPGAHINTPTNKRLPNILSVRFDGVNARELLTMLDVNGVYASAGAACTADSDKPSRVLLASGLTEDQALSTIRLSFCPETTPEEFSFVADALRRAVSQVRLLTE